MQSIRKPASYYRLHQNSPTRLLGRGQSYSFPKAAIHRHWLQPKKEPIPQMTTNGSRWVFFFIYYLLSNSILTLCTVTCNQQNKNSSTTLQWSRFQGPLRLRCLLWLGGALGLSKLFKTRAPVWNKIYMTFDRRKIEWLLSAPPYTCLMVTKRIEGSKLIVIDFHLQARKRGSKQLKHRLKQMQTSERKISGQ